VLFQGNACGTTSAGLYTARHTEGVPPEAIPPEPAGFANLCAMLSLNTNNVYSLKLKPS